MFNQTQFKILYAYHWHTNHRLIDRAAKLSEEDYRENPGYGHGSIHDLLFHILRTEQAWRMALETGQQQAPTRPEDFPDLPALQAGFEREQEAWTERLESLSDEEIQGNVQLTSWRGETYTLNRWRVLQHLVLHGMQHHTEIAQILTNKGQSPGDIDFIFYR